MNISPNLVKLENVTLDTHSGIATVAGSLPVSQLIKALSATDWMWPFPDLALSIQDWINHRMEGWQRGDPVAQIVCGLNARLPSDEQITIRPAPRRAVGPDLIGASLLSPGLWRQIDNVHLVVCPRVKIVECAYLFSQHQEAQAAQAWIRGRGAHPLALRVARTQSLQSVLQCRIADYGERTTLLLEIIDQIATKFAGVATHEEISLQIVSAPTPNPIIQNLSV